MLVLTRKVDESLIIGDTITVTILAVEGDKVKLGIVAPRDVPILRQELHRAILEQNMIEARLATGPEPDTFQVLRQVLLNQVDSASQPGETTSPDPGLEKSQDSEQPSTDS